MVKAKKAEVVSDKKDVSEGKGLAVVAYLTWVGILLAFVLNMEKKNSFVKFHIRQALMIYVSGFMCGVVMIVPILGWIAGFIGFILLLIFWIMGLVSAINGEENRIPIIGDLAQDWFKGI